MICPLIIPLVDMLELGRFYWRDDPAQAMFGSTDYVYLHEAETLDYVWEVGRLPNIVEQILYQSFNGVFHNSCLNRRFLPPGNILHSRPC